MIVEQVEIHYISSSHRDYAELDKLCFLSKNLYNATLYAVRQHYFRTGELLRYESVNLSFTHENQKDYRTLPAKVSKWVQKLVEQDFRSFLSLRNLKEQGKYENPVRLPKYADKIKGRKKLHYEKGAISFVKPGYLKLSGTQIEIKTALTKKMVRYVEIVPALQGYKVIVGYQKDCPRKQPNGKYASIDLGLNNLASVTSNAMDPFIVNGKPLKSINQYANKKAAHFQSMLPRNRKTSRRIRKIYTKRQHKIRDYMHKASTYIVNQLVSHDIHTLILGYNKKWKQDANIGKVSNQNFVQVPFYLFKEMLSYKCKLQGIILIEQEESYTSKCSFLDDEPIRKHTQYKGVRQHRGLFRSSQGQYINADINGSLNIMKKCLLKQEAWNSQLWLNLVEVCSMPNVRVITCA